MNYTAALADFSHIYTDAGHLPACVTDRSSANLAVYRNNVRENRVVALADIFPTIESLVGEDFFAAMARVYVGQENSTSANLHEDGERFPAFLSAFPHVQDEPYLPGVARLDLALHRAHYAVDQPSLLMDALTGWSAQSLASSRLIMHPAVALVRSDAWPIGAILDYHHGGVMPDLAGGGEAVLVWRDHWEIMQAADADCLACWLGGGFIESGLLAAKTCDGQWDAGPLWLRLFSKGLVTGIQKGDSDALHV